MPHSIITYKGKKILFEDYTKCKNKKEMLALLFESADYQRNQIKGEYLLLHDYNGVLGSKDFLNAAKDINQEFGHRLIKEAVIGVSSELKYILFRSYNSVAVKEAKAFESKEEALEYLIT